MADSVKVNPSLSFGALVGDLNIKAQNEKSYKLGRKLEGSIRDRGYINQFCHGHALGVWRKLLQDWTEVVQPFPIHFCASSLRCSRIDRGWVSCPSNLLIKLQANSHVVGSPEELYAVSDHAPFVIAFGKPVVNKGSCSIPQFICKHEKFKVHLNSLVNGCELRQQPNHKILEVYKICLREASRLTRRDVLYDEDSLPARRMIFASMSRAIWFNNTGLAYKLHQSTTLAQVHISVVGGSAICNNWDAFDTEFNDCHARDIQDTFDDQTKQRNSTERICVKKQLKSRIQKYLKNAEYFLGERRTFVLDWHQGCQPYW